MAENNIHRVRLPQELADQVNEIIEVINKEIPGANASFSSVARHALQAYVGKFHRRWKDQFPNQGVKLDGSESWLNDEDEDEKEQQ